MFQTSRAIRTLTNVLNPSVTKKMRPRKHHFKVTLAPKSLIFLLLFNHYPESTQENDKFHLLKDLVFVFKSTEFHKNGNL